MTRKNEADVTVAEQPLSQDGVGLGVGLEQATVSRLELLFFPIERGVRS
jgi:hypothetical protein